MTYTRTDHGAVVCTWL